jgi:Spy/CpxP family protein refolding chaperone
MSARILAASLLALSLAAQPALPQGPQGPRPGGPMAGGPMAGGPMARLAQAGEQAAFMAHHLKLSDPQKAQIKDIHQKHRDAIKSNQKVAMEAREAFRKAAQDPSTSPDQLRKLHQIVADRQFDQLLERRAMRLDTRAVLTPEQRTEADRLQALGEERRQFRMERMRKALERGLGRPGMGQGGPGRGMGTGGPG